VEDIDGGSLASDLGLAQSVSSASIYGSSVTDSGFTSLRDIGITSSNNGLLSLDTSILNQVLTDNPKLLERLFTAREVGVGTIASKKISFITQTTGGTISNRTTAIQNIIDDIDDRIEAGERRLLQFEERLQTQFSALELTLAQLQTQSEYLDSQLANLGNVFTSWRR